MIGQYMWFRKLGSKYVHPQLCFLMRVMSTCVFVMQLFYNM